MKNKITILMGLLLCFIFSPSVRGYAMDMIPDIEPEGPVKEITITLDAPEGFQERVEVYLNGSPRPLSYDADLENNGYTMHIKLAEDIYDVKVLSSTNIDDRYRFEAPEIFDTVTDTSLLIQVIDTAPEGEVEPEYDEHHDMVFRETEKIEPLRFDLSKDGPYGTIFVSCKGYGAVQSAVYRLVGEQRVYEITLDREHGFEAEVLLPPGSYYESGTIDVNLDVDAECPDETRFQWAHADNMGFFGNYYDVTDGTVNAVNDLIIMMSYDGAIEEINSNTLFRSTLMDNYLSAQESHIQKELESAFPESFSETETIPSAEPIIEDQNYFKEITVIAFTVLAVLVITSLTIIYYRRKKTKR